MERKEEKKEMTREGRRTRKRREADGDSSGRRGRRLEGTMKRGEKEWREKMEAGEGDGDWKEL